MKSLENYPEYKPSGETPTITDPLFEIGYGLSTKQSVMVVVADE